MKTKFIQVVFMCWFLFGCGAQLSDYDERSLKFDLFEYFAGDVMAWGMVQDYSGKQTRSFEVSIVGSIVGDRLTLVEDFVFNDGEQQQRIWVIDKQADGSYQGRADDVVGTAIGAERGNAMQWRYDLLLPWGKSTTVVAMDDWLYRQDETHLFNITKINKFGVEVGQVTIFFEKQFAVKN